MCASKAQLQPKYITNGTADQTWAIIPHSDQYGRTSWHSNLQLAERLQNPELYQTHSFSSFTFSEHVVLVRRSGVYHGISGYVLGTSQAYSLWRPIYCRWLEGVRKHKLGIGAGIMSCVPHTPWPAHVWERNLELNSSRDMMENQVERFLLQRAVMNKGECDMLM